MLHLQGYTKFPANISQDGKWHQIQRGTIIDKVYADEGINHSLCSPYEMDRHG